MGKTRVMGLVGLVVAVALLGACKSDSGSSSSSSSWFGNDDTQAVTIHNQWQGSEPAFKVPGALLIDSQAKLDAYGNTQLSSLGVDFNTQSIVVFALGEQHTAGFWVWITGVQRAGEKLWVQATVNRPAAGATVAQVVSSPIAAAVIDRQGEITQVYTDTNAVEGQEIPSPTASPAPAVSGTMEPIPAPASK